MSQTSVSQDAPASPAAIPDSITLNETVFFVKDHPELKDFITKVARVEKSKLYSGIKELKQQVEALKEVEITGMNNGLSADEITSLVGEIVRAELKPLLDQNKIVQNESLEDYRKRLLEEAGDECIVSLVKGGTKEELDASMQLSKSAYAEANTRNEKIVRDLQEKIAANKQTVDPLLEAEKAIAPTGESVDNSTAPVQKPVIVAPVTKVTSQSATPPVPRNVKQMSMEQYAAERDTILREVQSL